MATRRSSSTSLSRYTRGQSKDEELVNRSFDFCNAFWGIADGGYDVLVARIRGAVKTTEELRNFWKERAAIEEDYAKRLAKLAKQALGKDELGELRSSLDMLRGETDRQATAHANLSQTMRKELEGPLAELLNKQSHFKRNTLASVEKSYKTKQTQETYVKRSRQRYEEDCVRINSYTAQSTLVQGKELERIQMKLDKTRQTVQANEREYAQYARALADTTSRWEREWKVFCDTCQDMEEDRIEFMKDNVWAYANAVSTVCVADDESCEKIRVSLELVEAEKEIEAFTQDYTTGPQIPDPPPFIDYNSPNAAQQQARQTYRIANFARSSSRMVGVSFMQSPMGEDEPTSAGHAGVGAVGTRVEPATTSRPTSAAATRAVPSATNGTSSSSSTPSLPGPPPLTNLPHTLQPAAPKPPVIQAATSAKPTTAPPPRPRAQDPLAEQIDHRAETVLKIGPNTYPVNISEDPQQARVNVNTASGTTVGDPDDPLAKKMAELRSASVRKGSENRRSTLETYQQSTPGPASAAQLTPSSGPAAAAVYNTGRAPSPALAPSPTANFMIPPSSRSTSPLPVEDVVSSYQQRFPGETSHRNSMNRGRQPGPQAQGGLPPRGVSPGKEGHAGVGAHGGSRSPSPLPISRSASPAMLSSQNHLGYNQQAPSQAPARAPSPLGIELDPNGQVAHDELAERMYRQQQPQSNPYQHAPQHSQGSYDSYSVRPGNAGNYGSAGNQRQYQQTPAQQQQPYYQTQRANNVGPVYSQQQQPTRMGTIPPSNTFQAPPPVQQPTQQHPDYGYDQRQQQPSHGGYPHAPNNGYQTNRDYNNPYVQQQQGGYRSPSPMLNRSPSPAPAPPSNAPPPTGQYTESGEPVLFYVKALYDYQATIDEEFDFQAEDIIAVTATPEDGWWSGELLDERRRVPGRTIFPSNFVALLN